MCVSSLLDVHSDMDHNRSVFTLYGSKVLDDLKSLCVASFDLIDISKHTGVHPRFGVVDVVPFVPYELEQQPSELDLTDAVATRNEFAQFAAKEFGTNTYLYGPERSLPDTRRAIRAGALPSFSADRYFETRGAMCVGARSPLVAYNLIIDASLNDAAKLAKNLRGDKVRTLVFEVGGRTQLSANLVAPWSVGPIQFYEMVEEESKIIGAELVGLVPSYCITESSRPLELYGLSITSTIEARAKSHS